MVGPVWLFVLAISSAALGSSGAGCGDELDDALGGDDAGGGDGDDAFTQIYNSSQFQMCKGCHAPNAPGKVEGTEATQNWSTRDTAYSALQGNASGLIGNFEGCNGVPFLGSSAEDSLLVAVFDEDVRMNFMLASAPDCDGDAISDMTKNIKGPLPASLLAELKSWVDAGAPNE